MRLDVAFVIRSDFIGCNGDRVVIVKNFRFDNRGFHPCYVHLICQNVFLTSRQKNSVKSYIGVDLFDSFYEFSINYIPEILVKTKCI